MRKKRLIVILIFCFFIGAGIVIQARMTDGERLYVSQKAVDDYKAQIEAEKKELADIGQLTRQAKENLSLYSGDDGGKMRKALREELQKNSIFAGTADVRGPGVVITVDDGMAPADDSKSINSLLVHDKDILQIINELHAAGAEAISVNGQRITTVTSVSCAGYTVRINGRTYARPFVIRAIGDSTMLTDRLIGPAGYGKELQEWGVQFKIQSASDIRIAGFDEDIEFHYMKTQKEE